MLKTFKFRLYPSEEQEGRMQLVLDKCRFVYNQLLDGLNHQETPNQLELQNSIPALKEQHPELDEVYSKTLQYESYRLFSNLRALSRLKKSGRKVGRLRFKGAAWFKTFTYNQSGFGIISTGKRCQRLHLSKIGDISVRMHRKVEGEIKQVTVKRYASGKWYAMPAVEQDIMPQPQPIKKVVGIDLGLIDIVCDSDGRKTENPRRLKKHAKRLAHYQRKLSRKKKGSSNRRKARLKVAGKYEKLVNSRDDYLHKLSRYYVDNYDAIGLENMPIDSMVHDRRLSKSILDASWGKLRQFMSYKAENAGKTCVFVDHRGTTQRCSQCGEVVKKELCKRLHNCPFCGFVAPRDYNSALEIKRLVIISLGQELPELAPVEILSRESMNQEAPHFSGG